MDIARGEQIKAELDAMIRHHDHRVASEGERAGRGAVGHAYDGERPYEYSRGGERMIPSG